MGKQLPACCKYFSGSLIIRIKGYLKIIFPLISPVAARVFR